MADTAHTLQARSEGIDILDGVPTVEFMGRRFRLAERIGLMPLMTFAWKSQAGTDTDDMEGFAALYSLLRDCIDVTRPQKPVVDDGGRPVLGADGQPVTEDAGLSEWEQFQRHATDTKAQAEDFLNVVRDTLEVVTARPTQRPVDSSAGPPTISESSTVPSTLRLVVDQHEGLQSVAQMRARLTG